MAVTERARLHDFVLQLGRAMNDAGDAVSNVQRRLLAVARAYGVTNARISVLPTLTIIALGDEPIRLEKASPVASASAKLKLNQVSALFDLIGEAERGGIQPSDGLRRLEQIRSLEPRLGAIGGVCGHMLLTLGVAMLLQPSWTDLATCAVLGALVGCLRLLDGRVAELQIVQPFAAAVGVTALATLGADHVSNSTALRALIPPLVTFLPGGVLTTATVDLASGEVIAGSSRVLWGFLQLFLLAFGIAAGSALVSGAGAAPNAAAAGLPLGWWGALLGVLIFALGVLLHYSPPLSAMPWLLLVLIVAWAGQLLGKQLIGGELSGFMGALLMTPLALAIARLPGGPPSLVTFLPAFWLLVPGAIGLIGVTELVSQRGFAGQTDFVAMVVSIVSIALGVLVGTAAARSLTSLWDWLRRARRAAAS